MKKFEVLETCQITGRGIAVFFAEEPIELPIEVGKLANITVIKPDGTKNKYKGGKEYARKVDSKYGEVVVLNIKNATSSDVPKGSIVEFENE